MPPAPRQAWALGPPGQPAGGSVASLITRAARVHAGRLAVAGPDGALTYRELMARSSALAGCLQARGADRAAPVAVLMRRGTAQLAAICGVLLSSAPYLCIEQAQPGPRIGEILRRSGARIVVTDQPDGAALRAFTGTVIPDGPPPAGPSRAPARPLPGDLAYILYTSGSSGAPKGVAVTHRGLANYTQHMISLLGLAARPASFACVTSLSTDLGHTAVFPALASGGCVHVIPPDVAQDPAEFAEYMQAHTIDVLKITPSHLSALLDDPGSAVLPGRALITGGEALWWALVDTVRELSGCRILNHYGPTETTVGSLAFEVGGSGRHRDLPTVPIGEPISGTGAVSASPDLRPVPDGEAGELLISGAGLARGYWQDPEQTSLRFVRGPGGVRCYRTGDRVRRHPDGMFEFLGRLDRQVKIRGHRVEPGEVESALRQVPAVRNAVVVGVADGRGGLRLVGYVIGAGDGGAEGAAAIRQRLQDRLPPHLVPAELVMVSEIPYLASGKPDLHALTTMAARGPAGPGAGGADGHAPR